MSKLYAALGATALMLVFAAHGPANATERRADGVRNVETHEFSSQRRHYRRHYYGPRYRHVRHWGPRYYYGPRYRHVRYWGPRYYYGPRYRYGYYGYPYYRPYRPAFWGPGFYAGPGISIGFGFGPRWW